MFAVKNRDRSRDFQQVFFRTGGGYHDLNGIGIIRRICSNAWNHTEDQIARLGIGLHLGSRLRSCNGNPHASLWQVGDLNQRNTLGRAKLLSHRLISQFQHRIRNLGNQRVAHFLKRSGR